MNDVIQKRIKLPEYRYEWLVALAPEIKCYAVESDMAEPIPFPVLVYRIERQVSPHEWVYEFSGTRINNLPNKRVQRTASGKGWRVRLANKIIGLGWWLAGNGSR